MKCTLWTETLESGGWRCLIHGLHFTVWPLPNSQFVRHFCLQFTAYTPFQAPLDTCLDSPCFASLSVHGLHFTVYAPSKNPLFSQCSCASRRIASNPRFAPKRDSKEGFQFGNPQAIRTNRLIRANLQIDSRESGHLSSSVSVSAMKCITNSKINFSVCSAIWKNGTCVCELSTIA